MEVVRDMIVSGAIAPDVPIRQDGLAADLNVSKIPLREALVRLEQDGLVVSHPNRGFFVRGMSAVETRQETARRVLAELNAAAAAGLPTVGALNRAFHMALVQPGRRALTTEITARLHVMADRYVRKHLEHKGRHLTAEAEHHEILQAWLNRDAAAVRRLVAEHLQHTLSDLRQEFGQEEGRD